MSEKNKLLLLDLLKQPGNDCCADCGAADQLPDWASANNGVFVCIKCSGMHRNLGVQCSVIKSLRLDTWTDEKCQFMASIGNDRANGVLEKNLPVCWRKPTPTDMPYYIERFIRAKYETKEFSEGNENHQTYCNGIKEGYLWKRERHQNKWNQRYFTLSSETMALTYYEKKDHLKPIKRLNIKRINVILYNKERTEKDHSMLISETNNNENKTRYYFVHADSAKEITDWYITIRAARYKAFSLDAVDCETADAILSRPLLKEGWLGKSGPKENDQFRKRWVAVDINRFMYFKEKFDSFAVDEIPIGPTSEEYCVAEGVEGKHPTVPYPFMVQTPKRVFNFNAETRDEMCEWMIAFEQAMKPVEWQLSPTASKEDRFSILSTFSTISQSSTSSGGSENST